MYEQNISKYIKALCSPTGHSTLLSYLQANFDMRLNVVLHQAELRPKGHDKWIIAGVREVNTIVIDALANGLPSKFCNKSHFYDCIESYHSQDSHPFHEYFNSLKSEEYDGLDYIKELSECVQFETLETEGVAPDVSYPLDSLRIWLRAVIAQTFDGKANELCLVFQNGTQGIGKTTFVNKLLPKELGYYMTGNFDPLSKDGLAAVVTNFMIFLDEMDALGAKTITKVKQIMSSQTQRYRTPYDKREETHERRASFIGTVNERSVLVDKTGNRRFVMLPMKSLDRKKLDAIDIKNVWRQALYEYRSEGKLYYFDTKMKERQDLYNQYFYRMSAEEELFHDHFRKPTDEELFEDNNITWFNATEIIAHIQSEFEKGQQNEYTGENKPASSLRLRLDRTSTREIGQIMQRYNYKLKTVRQLKRYALVKRAIVRHPELEQTTAIDARIKQQVEVPAF